MRAPGIRRKGAASFEVLKPVCQVLILHEDFPSYTRAVEVCRRIMARFAGDLEFSIKCWNFIELSDPNCARHAAKTATTSDIIMLSMFTVRSPVELDRWFEGYFTACHRADGVLALMLNHPGAPPLEAKKLSHQMEQLAARLGMDYVSLGPNNDGVFVDVVPAAIAPRAAAQ
jgi:hypothetical protein